MKLAIFDLDNTLIGGDSDHLWGEFLVERGLVASEAFARENDRFYEDYLRGELDIKAYLTFAAKPLMGRPAAELAELHREFLQDKIFPIDLPPARELLRQHRAEGDFLLIITATNRFITEPIAEWLGVDDILASELAMQGGMYTGSPTGVPCYQVGKVTRLTSWLEDNALSLKNSYFYSDSHNDFPLLEMVDNPVAVDPDPKLEAAAKARGWPVISLRD